MGHQYISVSYRPRYRPSRDLYKDSMLISLPPRKLTGLCQQTTPDRDSMTPRKLTGLCQQTTPDRDSMTPRKLTRLCQQTTSDSMTPRKLTGLFQQTLSDIDSITNVSCLSNQTSTKTSKWGKNIHLIKVIYEYQHINAQR